MIYLCIYIADVCHGCVTICFQVPWRYIFTVSPLIISNSSKLMSREGNSINKHCTLLWSLFIAGWKNALTSGLVMWCEKHWLCIGLLCLLRVVPQIECLWYILEVYHMQVVSKWFTIYSILYMDALWIALYSTGKSIIVKVKVRANSCFLWDTWRHGIFCELLHMSTERITEYIQKKCMSSQATMTG